MDRVDTQSERHAWTSQRLNSMGAAELTNLAQPWDVYRSTAEQYSNYLTEKPGLLRYLIESTTHKKTDGTEDLYGLDLLAETSALRSLGASGIAVGLSDTRNSKEIVMDEGKRTVISSNILRSKEGTWKKIREKLKEDKKSGFDFIIQRGMAGLPLATRNPLERLYHLKQMYDLLLPNGIIFSEIRPTDKYLLQSTNMLDHWSSTIGIEVKIERDALVLKKLPPAPSSLPILNVTDISSELKKAKNKFGRL